MVKINLNNIKYLLLIVLVSFFIGLETKAANSDVLTVEGNKFLLNGQPILLRGVAMGDPHDRIVNYKRSSRDDYRAIKNDWQANVVRLSIHQGVFLNDWTRGKKILEDEVASARGLGLFVIIDWHVIGGPDGWYKSNDTDKRQYYTYNSDFSLAKRFWQYAVEKFKNDRGIIFELWNEPASENNDLSWNELRAYLAQLVEQIRGAASQNVILAPGVNWGYDLRGIKADPLGGKNIAYTWHVYNNNGSTISRETALDSLNQDYPVFITEWGSNNDKDLGFSVKQGQNVYGYLESIKNLIISQGLSYTAWCWHSSWKPNMFKSSWQELNNYGLVVKDFLDNPDKVKVRLAADEEKKNKLEAEARLAEERKLAEEKRLAEERRLSEEKRLAEEKAKQAAVVYDAKSMKEREFKLRAEAFINFGVDTNSAKLNQGSRQTIFNNFILAFGHSPLNENEWQDLMLITNGYWPFRSSQAAEAKAKKDFVIIFKRAPDMNVNGNRQAVKILAYGLRPRTDKRNIKKEISAISNFNKKFKRLPKSEQDWKFIRALAYAGVKN